MTWRQEKGIELMWFEEHPELTKETKAWKGKEKFE